MNTLRMLHPLSGKYNYGRPCNRGGKTLVFRVRSLVSSQVGTGQNKRRTLSVRLMNVFELDAILAARERLALAPGRLAASS
jgi:hypothetical protein